MDEDLGALGDELERAIASAIAEERNNGTARRHLTGVPSPTSEVPVSNEPVHSAIISDATIDHAAISESTKPRRRRRLIVGAAVGLVAVAGVGDAEPRVVWVNAAFEELTGLASGDVVGQPLASSGSIPALALSSVDWWRAVAARAGRLATEYGAGARPTRHAGAQRPLRDRRAPGFRQRGGRTSGACISRELNSGLD